MKTVLLTGGAGYIGSHIAYELLTHQYKVIILDWDRNAVLRLKNNSFFQSLSVEYVIGDCGDRDLLSDLFERVQVDAVVHCAAFVEVGRSVKEPLLFYDNNVVRMFHLLAMMQEHAVKQMIFSSSCAVYGMPQVVPIVEDEPKKPLSPYGKTKLMGEFLLEDFAQAYDFNYVALRYFNAAGALPEIGLGELHEPETHIIPRALQAAYTQEPFMIFGRDYSTNDGTCVRDYLHVRDIAIAHRKALEFLACNTTSIACNLGTGNGYSVDNIIAMTQEVTGLSLPTKTAPRRDGDPAQLVADATKAGIMLNWIPMYSDLKNIVSSAHEFAIQHQKMIHAMRSTGSARCAQNTQ